MGRLVVRNRTNTKMPTKKPTSALAEIRRKRRYFVFSTVYSNYLIFVMIYSIVLEIVIFIDISAVSEPILIKTKMILSFKCVCSFKFDTQFFIISQQNYFV